MKTLAYKDAAHLLRRVGFGGPPDEITTFVKMKREKAVDQLINYSDIDNSEMERRLTPAYEFIHATSPNDLNVNNFNAVEIRSWWVSRLYYSRRTFEEKMTLFWHNFFATSLDKVPVEHMYVQNLDLRQFALARFDDLLLRVSQGAAMLIWLDSVTSTRTSPNENFARELQELFTMGTNDVVTGEPNYTEQDVKEISRAFTGWRFRPVAGDPSPFAYEFFVDENQADFGSKTIQGQTANFTGEDVIKLFANKRATGRYLVKRLFEFFVYPLDSNNAQDRATINKFADVYFASDHSIKELVRAIFVSDEFFSTRARLALVKNPVEFAIGAMKMLKTEYRPGTPDKREVTIEESLRAMGMDLFSPPDVFGWDLNLGFVTNDAMLERFNFADLICQGNSADPEGLGGVFPVHPLHLLDYAVVDAKQTMKSFLHLLGELSLDKKTTKELTRFLNLDFRGADIGWDISDAGTRYGKLQGFARLILCLPESQMN